MDAVNPAISQYLHEVGKGNDLLPQAEKGTAAAFAYRH